MPGGVKMESMNNTHMGTSNPSGANPKSHANDERSMASQLIRLIEDNDDVQRAMIEVVLSCPNIMRQY
jgi:hypothetical protein